MQGLFAWVLSVIVLAGDDWFIGGTFTSGDTSTIAACHTVDEEDGYLVHTVCSL